MYKFLHSVKDAQMDWTANQLLAFCVYPFFLEGGFNLFEELWDSTVSTDIDIEVWIVPPAL